MIGEQKGVEKFLNFSKSLLALLKELAIIILIVIVLIWPNQISKALDRAGISELDLGIIKMQNQLIEANENAQDANQIIEQQQQELQAIKSNIKTIERRTDLTPQVKNEIKLLDAKIDKTVETTESAKNRITHNITVQSDLINRYQILPFERAGRWGIVVGADKTEDEAIHELNGIRELGYNNTRIYLRANWYRVVILFDDYEAADKELPKIRSNFRKSAYAVNLARWCPSSIERTPGILYECK